MKTTVSVLIWAVLVGGVGFLVYKNAAAIVAWVRGVIAGSEPAVIVTPKPVAPIAPSPTVEASVSAATAATGPA